MEANVIYRISKGDEQAFDRFMDYWSDALYRYAYGILGVREPAEEVVSDVFVEIWRGRAGLLEIESMAAYLRTLTYRKAVSALRHENVQPHGVSLDVLEDYTVSPVEAPDDAMMRQEDMDRLNSAIESLPPKCKHVFCLAKIERVPYKEICDLLKISVATVNYHVGYAMDALRKKLRPPE